jgi:putative ABC transport system permease protein
MKPPRLAGWLLRRALPPSDRGAVLGDLHEEFESRLRSGDRARAWYWGQAIASLPHALRLRAPRIESIRADAVYTLRVWRRHPAFALAAIATQAIGIAVTTAVLAVAYAVLVRPLPYAEPGRLVHLFEGRGNSGQLSFPDYLDLKRANRSLALTAGYSGGSRTLTMPGAPPERLPMLAVTAEFFPVLGVPPALGRNFVDADMARGAPAVVMLSHDAWVRRFGGDRSVPGRLIALGGVPTEIIGVLPASFAFPLRGRPELWLPLRPSVEQEERGYMHWMQAIARPRPGVTAPQVQADLDAVARLLSARDPKNHADAYLQARPLREVMVSGVRPTINALLAGVALVMLVTCATTATLLLSRAATRSRELSVRSALGAARSRIVRQLLTENLILSLVGGVIGIALGHALLRAFVARMPAQQRVVLPYFDNPGVGAAVACAALAVAVVTGIVFGIPPAWRASRTGAGDTLRTARTTAGGGELRLRSALVSLQVAVALVLVAGAALLATSVNRLLNVPAGFDPNGLVMMRMNLPPKYSSDAVRSFQRQLLHELRNLHGVTAAALIDQAPLSGAGNSGAARVIGRSSGRDERGPDVALRTVSHEYFAAMRVPLLRGRTFSDADTMQAPRVVVVNRLLADTVLAGVDPIGQRIAFEFIDGDLTVVGVVDNERLDDLDRPLLPALYFPSEQDAAGSFAVVLRAADTGAAVADGRQVIARLDPDLPIFGIRTIEQVTSESAAVFLRRATLWMLGIFAVASLVLAAMGLYGVLSQTVADRTREIGIRVALGASRGRIAALVARGALAAAAAGVVAGIAGTFAASRWLSSLLYGVGANDPRTISAAVLFLLVIALVACFVPTRRALRIDPASAVRIE